MKLLKQFALWQDIARSQAFEHVQDNIGIDTQQWLVLDGSFNSTWISEVEALLDTYQTTVLKNGKRISLTSTFFSIYSIYTICRKNEERRV